MSYVVRLSDPAHKDFARLDRTMQKRVADRMEQLAADPFDPRISKQLRQAGNRRTSRVGNWRIIYTVNRLMRTLEVSTIRPRGEAYKKL